METNKLSSAAFNGLLLALVTILSTLITTVIEPGVAISIILWIVKLVATVWLLYYFIREFSKPKEYFRYGDGLSYGVLVSFFSAIICACYFFLHLALLFPETMNAQMEQVIESLQSRLTIIKIKPLQKENLIRIIDNIKQKENIEIDQDAENFIVNKDPSFVALFESAQ